MGFVLRRLSLRDPVNEAGDVAIFACGRSPRRQNGLAMTMVYKYLSV